MDEVSRAIMRTLAFFDINSRPLTDDELYRFLWSSQSYDVERVRGAMSLLLQSGQVVRNGGFVSLPTSENLNARREQALRYSLAKMQRARIMLRLLSSVPFVRAIMITNSVAAETARPGSDLDLLIVTASKRLWIARLLTLVLLDLFRLRPRPGHRARAICPCFFVSVDALDFSSLTLGAPDIYLAYWLCQLVPLYDSGGIHAQIVKQNTWVSGCVRHGLQPSTIVTSARVTPLPILGTLKKFFEAAWSGAYGDLIVSQAKQIQLPRLRRTYGELSELPDTRVIIRDDMVKLHKNDRRAEYRERWQKRCQELAVL